MIKVTVRYNDHLVDIHFPCSETTLRSALMEIHAADDNPPELFVTDVIFPEELDHLKDRFVNLDELNYLAKRIRRHARRNGRNQITNDRRSGNWKGERSCHRL